MTDWVVTASPEARKGRAGVETADMLRSSGASAQLSFTHGAEEARDIVSEAIGRGIRRVAVCGGDGTIHGILGVLANSDVTLGIVPCGRGNDLARALGIPNRVEDAVRTLTGGVERRIDLGRIGDRYFATVASVGFDAAVALKAREGAGGGKLQYFFAALRQIGSYVPGDLTVKWVDEDGPATIPSLLVAVGNTSFYGGGIRILPEADCEDGVLDVCIVEDVSKSAMLELFGKAHLGKHVGHPAVRMNRVRRVRLETVSPEQVVADGEPVGKTPVEIDVVEKALSVICPGE